MKGTDFSFVLLKFRFSEIKGYAVKQELPFYLTSFFNAAYSHSDLQPSRALTQLGERIHTMRGNVYRVVEKNPFTTHKNGNVKAMLPGGQCPGAALRNPTFGRFGMYAFIYMSSPP